MAKIEGKIILDTESELVTVEFENGLYLYYSISAVPALLEDVIEEAKQTEPKGWLIVND